VGVVVSPAKRMRLRDWPNIFHERIFFQRPTQDMRIKCWKRVLNSSIPLADDVDVQHLARDYKLCLEEIQAVVHRACLLMAAEDPEGLLNAEPLEKAIRLVREKSNRQEYLFGLKRRIRNMTHLSRLLWNFRFKNKITCEVIARGLGYANMNKGEPSCLIVYVN